MNSVFDFPDLDSVGMMPHKVNVYRPAFVSGATAETISGYTKVANNVPSFIQPVDAKEEFYYEQRGQEVSHLVYTSATYHTFQRNDILQYGSRELHVVGVIDGLELDVYKQLTCLEYPETAAKRLPIEAYQG